MPEEDRHNSRRLRLQTLVRPRWLAVGGRAVTVFIVAFWLRFPLPLIASIALIAALAAVNFYLMIRYPPTHRIDPGTGLCVARIRSAAALRPALHHRRPCQSVCCAGVRSRHHFVLRRSRSATAPC